MNITYYQLILLFIASCIIGAGSILDEFQTHRPIIACPIIGLILGNLKIGIILGGTLEMISLGWMNVGAAISPDSALASIISTILVISGKQPIGTGIALSIPLAAAGQILNVIIRSITVGIQHTADKITNKYNNTKYISYIHFIALFLHSIRVAIPATIVAITIKTEIIQNILNSIPIVITSGLNIAGGIIVIVGYSMVINMIKSEYLMPFFYLGFVIAGFTSFNLIALGIIGLILSILYTQLSPKYYKNNKEEIKKNNSKIKDDELD